MFQCAAGCLWSGFWPRCRTPGALDCEAGV